MAEKTTDAPKAMPKSLIYKELAAKTGLEAKQVSALFEALEELVKTELSKKNGAGEFVIPNLVKLSSRFGMRSTICPMKTVSLEIKTYPAIFPRF